MGACSDPCLRPAPDETRAPKTPNLEGCPPKTGLARDCRGAPTGESRRSSLPRTCRRACCRGHPGKGKLPAEAGRRSCRPRTAGGSCLPRTPEELPAEDMPGNACRGLPRTLPAEDIPGKELPFPEENAGGAACRGLSRRTPCRGHSGGVFPAGTPRRSSLPRKTPGGGGASRGQPLKGLLPGKTSEGRLPGTPEDCLPGKHPGGAPCRGHPGGKLPPEAPRGTASPRTPGGAACRGHPGGSSLSEDTREFASKGHPGGPFLPEDMPESSWGRGTGGGANGGTKSARRRAVIAGKSAGPLKGKGSWS
ncbi:cuticle collagen 34-like [Penaeus monodon]|uniref:cuticle collagen 34-like n=1 Tax=Penaeus monodon TaxID=6687 RepID=UPI0018A6E213|nr:cuticle collagen 34-like [Penaeus monodon]